MPFVHLAQLSKIESLFFALIFSPLAFADPTPIEVSPEQFAKKKEGYHLFNPTPQKLMRDFTTDRPDRTESPYSVDAGHIQIETDIVSWVIERSNGAAPDQTFNLNQLNFKVGLTNSIDLQGIFQTFNLLRTTSQTHNGYGDTTFRLKINLMGNDGGPIAFGIMPLIKFPTAISALGNGSVEGGVILPLAVALPYDWSMGTMMEFDIVRNSLGSGYHPQWISTITIGHQLPWNFEFYLELYSQVGFETNSSWDATFDGGLVYEMSEHTKLDLGINIGLTDGISAYNPFIGLSYRY